MHLDDFFHLYKSLKELQKNLLEVSLNIKQTTSKQAKTLSRRSTSPKEHLRMNLNKWFDFSGFVCLGVGGREGREEYLNDEVFKYSIFFHIIPSFWVFFFPSVFICYQILCENVLNFPLKFRQQNGQALSFCTMASEIDAPFPG